MRTGVLFCVRAAPAASGCAGKKKPDGPEPPPECPALDPYPVNGESGGSRLPPAVDFRLACWLGRWVRR
jgi:hypothetical protein